MTIDHVQRKFLRSSEGPIFGICEGLGKSFEMPPWVIRALFVLSFFLLGGTGLLAYIFLRLSMPTEANVFEAEQPKILGVCYRLSRQWNMEVALVRFLALVFATLSLGTVVLVYFVLHFVLPPPKDVINL